MGGIVVGDAVETVIGLDRKLSEKGWRFRKRETPDALENGSHPPPVLA